jgi:tRNA/rRNA methyltransferase
VDGLSVNSIHTRFVLIEPSHPGNVGATARAMKVMGFDDLVLVRPRWPDVLLRTEAIERASGADDVLAHARVVPAIDAALDGMTHVCATVMTPRDFGPPTEAPRAHFDALLRSAAGSSNADGGNGMRIAPDLSGVAFLFGCERFGMANDDVYHCHVALSIPTNPAYGSLNLAAAVQLIAYDWRQALDAHAGGWGRAAPRGVPGHVAADSASVDAMLEHWRETLIAIDFLDPAAPKKLMPRLQQLFNRAQPSMEEINILRGIARAAQRSASNTRAGPEGAGGRGGAAAHAAGKR